MNKKEKITAAVSVGLCCSILLAYTARIELNKEKQNNKDSDTTSLSYFLEDTEEKNNTSEISIFESQDTFKNSGDQNISGKTMSYQELESRVAKICKDNKYDDNLKSKLIDMFKIIITNYDSYYKNFYNNGFMDCYSFINYYLNHLEKSNVKIACFDSGDKKYATEERILNNAGASAMYDGNNNLVIIFNGDNSSIWLATLFEEIVHSTQTGMYKTVNPDEYYSYSEGETATYRMLFMDTLTDEYTSLAYDDEDNCYIISAVTGGDSAVYGNRYIKLCSIAGFDRMVKLKQTGDFDTFYSELNKEYGINIDLLKKCLSASTDDMTKQYQLENIYLDVLSKKLDFANNQSQLESIMYEYRYLKNQFGIKILKDGKNITNTKIKYAVFEQKLKEKLSKSNAISEEDFENYMNDYENIIPKKEGISR